MNQVTPEYDFNKTIAFSKAGLEHFARRALLNLVESPNKSIRIFEDEYMNIFVFKYSIEKVKSETEGVYASFVPKLSTVTVPNNRLILN